MQTTGVSDEVANKVKASLQDLEITQNGNEFVQKSISAAGTQEIKFELGKEFEEKRMDGRTVNVCA